jgi:hypothetical protein
MSSTATSLEARAHGAGHASFVRQLLRFALHTTAVYVLANFTSMWVAGRIYAAMPLILQHRPTDSPMQFAFSHLFLFSFSPALIVAFAYSQWYPHRVAQFVCIVPAAILAYMFCTFSTSAFESRFAAAYHEYFEGEFVIGTFNSFTELFRVASASEMQRALLQLRFTAPAYAGVGYSMGAWLGIRYEIPKVTEAWRKLRPTWRRTSNDQENSD